MKTKQTLAILKANQNSLFEHATEESQSRRDAVEATNKRIDGVWDYITKTEDKHYEEKRKRMDSVFGAIIFLLIFTVLAGTGWLVGHDQGVAEQKAKQTVTQPTHSSLIELGKVMANGVGVH